MAALERFPEAGFVHSNFFVWKPEHDERRPDGLRSWFPRPFEWDEMYAERVRVRLDADARPDGGPDEVDAYAGDLYYWSIFSPMVLPSTAIIRRGALAPGERFPERDSVGDWEFFARLSHRRGAVFVPVETTLNRSHDDAVRLTRHGRHPPAAAHRPHPASVAADEAFAQAHAADLDRVETGCLRRLARLSIAAGRARRRASRSVPCGPSTARSSRGTPSCGGCPRCRRWAPARRSSAARRHLPGPPPAGF